VAAIKTFGEVDERSLRQLRTCMAAGDAELGVLCADHHPGYSQPIGGGIAYEGFVSPSGTGYDIGCGNKAVRTNVAAADLDVAAAMREIGRRISFGMGVPNRERVDHPVLDRIVRADFAPQRKLHQLARAQLGTVRQPLREPLRGRGGDRLGRRALRLARVRAQDGVGVSRARAGGGFEERSREGEMDSPPVLFRASPSSARRTCPRWSWPVYAYARRDVVVAKVLEILRAQPVHEVHNHHNFAWREEHFGRTYWVIRKGCTPAWPGQEGFVGGSMGDDSVVLEGVAGPDSADGLYSTVHGAGRVMSRSQAAGRVRRATVYACTVHDCEFFVSAREYESQVCPEHATRLRRARREIVVRPGVVDWPAVQARLRRQGIMLVGGGADEAPEVYKRLPDVLAAHTARSASSTRSARLA
jgi:tRNA-splicing ligase RtcB (3'-phosphate/5'-hydroxy nucleic acid ligase)